MSTSGQTPANQRTTRPARVAPRRHVAASTEQPPAISSYDSHEFPVLLRMPDVSVTLVGDSAADSPSSPVADSSAALEGSTSGETSGRRKRHRSKGRGSNEGSGESNSAQEQRFTGKAATQFWSRIPPQLASGGMLLAVIALCFVLLRGTTAPAPNVDDTQGWSTGQSPTMSDDLATDPITPVPLAPSAAGVEWHRERSSVAAKPAGPVTEPATGAKAPSSVPLKPMSSVPVYPVLPSDESVAPVQGWPSDTVEAEAGGSTMLNAPLESADRPTLPALRISQRESRPPTSSLGAPPSLAPAPQHNGTIEIPPPTPLYRQ